MRTELVVRGDKRETQEAVAGFFRERGDLYHGVTGPLRLTDYRAVEAKVNAKHGRFVAARGCLSIIVGLFDPVLMQDAAGDQRIEVVAKAVGDGTRLRIAARDGVKPEAVEPLLIWLREELGAVEA